MTATDTPLSALPRTYLTWVGGFTISRLGDAVLMFALGWAASGLGGTTAAAVLTVSALPRLAVLVLGGAVADRVGARRILIAGEAILVALTAVLALAFARFGTPAWLLMTSSLALGTVTAFCLPAAGSQPRRLVPDDLLSRALALRQALSQAVLMAAAPLGGLLVGAVGLSTIAWIDAVLLGVGLCVLIAIHEMASPSSEVAVSRSRGWPLDLVGGLHVVVGTPGLRNALILAGAGAALMLPVPSLLVPLLGRASSWGPGSTGVVAGAVGVGMISAAFMTARRRRLAPQVGVAATGIAVSAGGALVLAAGSAFDGPGAVPVVVAGALIFGFGNGLFVARLAPLVLGSAPRTHLARVQAIVGLAQLVPVMVTNAIFGVLAQYTSPGWVFLTICAGLTGCAAWARRPGFGVELAGAEAVPHDGGQAMGQAS